jgi:hypothetical protein
MYVPYCRRYERELFQGRLRNILVVKDKNQIEDLSSHPLRYLAHILAFYDNSLETLVESNQCLRLAYSI